MNTPERRLATLITDFCSSTIFGHESGFYKAVTQTPILLPLPLSALLSDRMLILVKHATLNYLNLAYRSLILKDDAYIVDKFNSMSSASSHSFVCLLNIICSIITGVHGNFDRTKFDISSYNSYMNSVKIQLDDHLNKVTDRLSSTLSHKCEGIDISTCDPEKPMFF